MTMSDVSRAASRRRRISRVSAHAKLINDVRRLHAAWLDAVRHEMNRETQPGHRGYAAYQRAVRVSEAVEKELERLSDSVLTRPVRGWDEVLLLAELAAAHDARSAGVVCASDNADEVVYEDRAHETLAALLEAVLQLGRRTSIRETR